MANPSYDKDPGSAAYFKAHPGKPIKYGKPLAAANAQQYQPSGVNYGGGGGGAGAAPVSTLAGIPPSPLLTELMKKGLIKEGMPPEQVLAILQLGEMRGGVAIDVDALIKQIEADYQNYTGDILTAGQDWMQNLMGTAYDPNDPNARMFADDPTFSSYAGGLTQMDETAQQNLLTDTEWFRKAQQADQASYDNMMAAIATGVMPVGASTGGSGGGGGGGRGGRHYGGGGGGSGGGSGDLGLSDPKTTFTSKEYTRQNDQLTSDAYFPNWANQIRGLATNPDTGEVDPYMEDFLRTATNLADRPQELAAFIEQEMAARENVVNENQANAEGNVQFFQNMAGGGLQNAIQGYLGKTAEQLNLNPNGIEYEYDDEGNPVRIIAQHPGMVQNEDGEWVPWNLFSPSGRPSTDPAGQAAMLDPQYGNSPQGRSEATLRELIQRIYDPNYGKVMPLEPGQMPENLPAKNADFINNLVSGNVPSAGSHLMTKNVEEPGTAGTTDTATTDLGLLSDIQQQQVRNARNSGTLTPQELQEISDLAARQQDQGYSDEWLNDVIQSRVHSDPNFVPPISGQDQAGDWKVMRPNPSGMTDEQLAAVLPTRNVASYHPTPEDAVAHPPYPDAIFGKVRYGDNPATLGDTRAVRTNASGMTDPQLAGMLPNYNVRSNPMPTGAADRFYDDPAAIIQQFWEQNQGATPQIPQSAMDQAETNFTNLFDTGPSTGSNLNPTPEEQAQILAQTANPTNQAGLTEEEIANILRGGAPTGGGMPGSGQGVAPLSKIQQMLFTLRNQPQTGNKQPPINPALPATTAPPVGGKQLPANPAPDPYDISAAYNSGAATVPSQQGPKVSGTPIKGAEWSDIFANGGIRPDVLTPLEEWSAREHGAAIASDPTLRNADPEQIADWESRYGTPGKYYTTPQNPELVSQAGQELEWLNAARDLNEQLNPQITMAPTHARSQTTTQSELGSNTTFKTWDPTVAGAVSALGDPTTYTDPSQLDIVPYDAQVNFEDLYAAPDYDLGGEYSGKVSPSQLRLKSDAGSSSGTGQFGFSGMGLVNAAIARLAGSTGGTKKTLRGGNISSGGGGGKRSTGGTKRSTGGKVLRNRISTPSYPSDAKVLRNKRYKAS